MQQRKQKKNVCCFRKKFGQNIFDELKNKTHLNLACTFKQKQNAAENFFFTNSQLFVLFGK